MESHRKLLLSLSFAPPNPTTKTTNTKGMTNIENSLMQGGITCGAIDEPRKSSKAIDELVKLNFCDKNVVIAHFRDKTA